MSAAVMEPEEGAPLRAVEYVRVSTDDQVDGQGLDIQHEANVALCEANGWELVASCGDQGVSGRKGFEDRPGLADAVGLVVDGQADVLVVYAVDRIARDALVLEVALRRLWDAGGRVASCRKGEEALLDPDNEDEPTRRLVRMILGALAEWERSMIVMRVRGARRRKILHGGYGGGPTSYGWEPDWKGAIVPVASEQEVVAVMVALRADGWTLERIAAELNGRSVRTRTGEPWSKQAVSRALAAASRGALPAGGAAPATAEGHDGGDDQERHDEQVQDDVVVERVREGQEHGVEVSG